MKKFDYAMMSRPGGRPYNEDCIQMHDSGAEQLFALCDGLGGMGNGDLASSTAIRSAVSRFRWDRSPDFLAQAVETAQGAVLYEQEKNPDTRDMSSTMVLLRFQQDEAAWVHIGDSRLYMFRDGQVLHQTEDHSVPQMLVRIGDITQEQIRSHPDRNRLLRALGWEWSDNKSYVVSESIKLQEGDAFLLCSDGFWEEIVEDEMIRILSETKDAATWLSRMTKIVETNGRDKNMDNYSAICVRIR